MPTIETLLLTLAVVLPLGFLFFWGQVAIKSAYLIQVVLLTLPIG